MNIERHRVSRLARMATLTGLLACANTWTYANRINELSHHFNEPGNELGSWMFVPEDNIRELSTDIHPGLITLYEDGKGADICGILEDPIPIDKYDLPWEFQTSLIQSFNGTAGVGVKTQVNYAVGMNLVVTFSDPSEWPEDRTQRPPDSRELQLLVVHLGSTGEAGIGLPQYTNLAHPETYLVWGRGDLGYLPMGDWQVPFITIGDGAKYAGPASPRLYFRCVVLSPTSIQVGIKFDPSHGWNNRIVDFAPLGPITGIWEIGPIISGDRWIPDVLCRSIPQMKGPHPLFLGNADPENYKLTMTPVSAPWPEAPNPDYEYYVDYCVFFGAQPRPFEDYSDEFNIPGYLGQWQVQEQCTLMDTNSHPGSLKLQLIGPGLGTGFGAAGGSTLSLSDYEPPWEIEIAFTGVGDSGPWNLWMNFIVFDEEGKQHGLWTPGVRNVPEEGQRKPFNHGLFDLEFDDSLTAEVLNARPLYMLIQCIDSSHVRLGFRGDPSRSWVFSKVFDVTEAMKGSRIGAFGMHCWSTTSGKMYGAPPGVPAYQTFLIDYVRYRYGVTE